MYIADVLELRSVDPNHKTDETLPPIYSFKVLMVPLKGMRIAKMKIYMF